MHRTIARVLAPLCGLVLIGLGAGCRYQDGLVRNGGTFHFFSRVESRGGTVEHGAPVARGSTVDLTVQGRPPRYDPHLRADRRGLRQLDHCLQVAALAAGESLEPLLETPETAAVLYRAAGTIVVRAERPGPLAIGWRSGECIVEEIRFEVVEVERIVLTDPARPGFALYQEHLVGELWEDELAAAVLPLLPGGQARLDLDLFDRFGRELAYAEGTVSATIEGEGVRARIEGHELILDTRGGAPGQRAALRLEAPGGITLERPLELVDPAELTTLSLELIWAPEVGGVALKATARLADGRPVLQPPVRWEEPWIERFRLSDNLSFAGRQDLIALRPLDGRRPGEPLAATATLEGFSVTQTLPPVLWEQAELDLDLDFGCQSADRGRRGLGLAFFLLLGLTLLTFRRWH